MGAVGAGSDGDGTPTWAAALGGGLSTCLGNYRMEPTAGRRPISMAVESSRSATGNRAQLASVGGPRLDAASMDILMASSGLPQQAGERYPARDPSLGPRQGRN